jgi:hypothetical protein
MMAAVVIGCASQQSSQRVANPNRYIYVTAQTVPGQCYQDLGTIEFEEPFAETIIDPDGANMARTMRARATAKYPRDVDAVINLRSEQNDAGTAVRVSGEAVEMEDRTTVTCALREVPSVMDSSAAAAGAGVVGTVVGGLGSGSPDEAKNLGVASALAAGAQALLEHRANLESQRQQLMSQLVDRQHQIKELQAQRARLQSCADQEISFADCESGQLTSVQSDSAHSPTPADYRDLSLFELQKQTAEQHDYIAQLKQQISDTRWAMDKPIQHP